MLPKKIQSLWMATTPATDYPELQSGIEVDVVVVGGGLAGLNTAYFLMREGLKVAVVEASYIGTGTSGNTTAKITSLHNLKYNYLKKYFGLAKAKIYGESNEWAISKLEEIIKTEEIDCDFGRLSSYVYTFTESGLQGIKEEIKACQEIGLPASFIEKPETPFPSKGAICFKNQAYFHPRKYILALAERIQKRGGYIFERSRASSIKQAGDKQVVVTDKAEIRGKHVVVATNFPFFDKGFFFARTYQSRSYVFSSVGTKNNIKGMFINTDLEDKKLSFRPHKIRNKESMIIGGEGHVVGEDGEENHYADLEKLANEKLGPQDVEFIWSAQDSMSMDRMPFIGKMPMAKNIYVVTGFGKWGITHSVICAKIITDLILGKENSWVKLYDPSRFNLSASWPEIKNSILRTFKNYMRKFEKKKEFNAKDLSIGEGMVADIKNQKTAVYKTEEGQIQMHSAVCTHMGCIVNWNSEEKTWDCPCHGSRFTPEGEIINGPATRSLPEIKTSRQASV